ncbi:MAG: biosynthetic arginine decarboxylase [Deltaproteobacteria bacterium]|nr:biosynthetic arginine decarboxylase [Deltaproteobacteria bacterium]
MRKLRPWSAEDSLELYQIPGWGQGYFGINDKGHMVAYPRRNGTAIDLRDLVEDAQSQGLHLPLLVRFSDILHDRLQSLHHSFHTAIQENDYEGRYLGVYPIKVNQQRQVVEEVVRFGAEFQMGLEVGSKPELHAVLAILETPGSVIVCNGYKDEAYIRLALLAQKLGRTVFMVVEKLGELPLILRVADEERVEPVIGLRLKLMTAGSGKWEDSGGDRSKFGLTSWEVMQAVDELRQAGRLNTLRLIHSHLGSQVSNIRSVRDAIMETARYYTELRKLGCPIDHVDMGGGLGVDYDGTRSTYGFSINYTAQEYANAIVSGLAGVCRNEKLPHPNIISESGRALTAHHAMLVVNVQEASILDRLPVKGRKESAKAGKDTPKGEKLPEPLSRLETIRASLTPRSYMELWHETLHVRDEIKKLFELGFLSLAHRAKADQMFWEIARAVDQFARRQQQLPDEMEALETLLADKYFCNFSVFQSLPDAWAIGQEFPVVPLHRLTELPSRRAILQDITCDSDGRIKNYISRVSKAETVPLHPLKGGEPYFLGIFLTGAYQEILGDLHNLFGNTNAVHVALQEDDTWHYEQIIHGENLSEVLAYVQFGKDILVDRIERQIATATRAGLVSHLEGKRFLDLYVEGLDSSTYLGVSPRPRYSRRQVRREEAV